jgi:CheY-like chemotaxis protein
LEAVRRIRQDIQSILIVDDEPEMVKLIQRMLSSYLKSENCYEAYGGEDALRVIREMKPDLILLDLTMPGMDGYEILDKMKAEPDLASIPVIIISGQTQDSSDPLVGDFRVESKDGFTIGQIAQMVEASLNVLSQSWRPIDSTA